MKKVKNIFFGVLLTAALYGGWHAWPTIKDTFINVPQQTTMDMVWHRWEQDGITLMALDQNQGLKLTKHFEVLGKKWRPSEQPDMPITLIVVNNKNVMKQLFGYDRSRREIRNGQLYIWFLWDDKADLGL